MAFQAKKNIKSEDLEKISDREDLSSRVYIYNGQKFLVKDSTHDDIFLEYVVSNIAHTILGNKAPEVFFIKNKNSPLKVASKFIDEYQSSKHYLSQYNNYPLPKECIVGCSLDINNQIQLTTNIKDPSYIIKTFPAIVNHEQVIVTAHFTEHSDLHSLNLGIKIENGIPYAAVIDFDRSQMFNTKLYQNFGRILDTIKPIGDMDHYNTYNLYFMYDRDNFAKTINEILKYKQEFINIISELEDPDISTKFKKMYDNDVNINDWLNNLMYKLAILEQEDKIFQLANAFKDKDINLINKLILEIDQNKIKALSIQAIQDIADYTSKEILSTNYTKFWDSLQTHDYYKYATINAAIKEDKHNYEADIATLPLNMAVLATAIKCNKIEVFNNQILSKILALNLTHKTQLLHSAIVFDREEIFNIIYDKLEINSKSDSYLWPTARSAMSFGRNDYLTTILAKLEYLSIEQKNNNELYKNFNNLFNDVVSSDYAIEINTLLTSLAPYQNYFHEALEESCKKIHFYKPSIEEALNPHCVNIGIDNTMIAYIDL